MDIDFINGNVASIKNNIAYFYKTYLIVMDIIERLKWRYATKKFDVAKLLSEEKLSIIKEAFNLTATSFGLQTVSLIIVSNMDKRQQLLQHSYHQKQVVEASHLLVICIQDDILDIHVDDLFDSVADVRKTPKEVLEPYRRDLKIMMQQMSQPERQAWSTKQAYIALGNLMTVCAVEGIDACPMEGFIPEKYDEVLHLKAQNLKSVLVLPVGYRAEDDRFASFNKVRKTIDDAVITL